VTCGKIIGRGGRRECAEARNIPENLKIEGNLSQGLWKKSRNSPTAPVGGVLLGSVGGREGA